LLREGQSEAVPILEEALGRADTDFRCELTQTLMTAAQEESVRDALSDYLSGKDLSELPSLCLALALRGGSGDLPDAQVPEQAPRNGAELLCAFHALGAMDNRAEDADKLKDMLRNGSEDARYCAASYLGLARVQSALPVWASVSDQVESSWQLRTLNAAMLVRRGHRLGMRWFAKNAEQRRGAQKPPMATQLARAVEDVLPLMLKCKTVNLGRFV
jgi:hypothetical protein